MPENLFGFLAQSDGDAAVCLRLVGHQRLHLYLKAPGHRAFALLDDVGAQEHGLRDNGVSWVAGFGATVGVEIERKFLVKGNDWRSVVSKSTPMRQGYLGGDNCSIRVRLEGDSANLNIKSLGTLVSRLEYEYSIDVHEAQELLDNFARDVIVKTRHYIVADPHTWEIDEFEGANDGLIVAEIELDDESQSFVRPSWVGSEVSEDKRYYNVALAKNPFSKW